MLLTPEERDSHCYKVSTTPLKEEYLFGELDGTLHPGPFVRVDDMLKHQLRKVCAEIEALNIAGRSHILSSWLEAARKEIE